MTGAEMITNWKIGFDVIASGAAPGFTDTEIYSLLNKAEDYLVLESHKNKQWDNIFTILNTVIVTSGSIGGSNFLSLVPLPNDFWLYIESYNNVNRTQYPTTGFTPNNAFTYSIVKNIRISIENAYKFLQTGFNDVKIFRNSYCYLGTGNYLSVLNDGKTTIIEVGIHYVKSRIPIDISNNSQLPRVMHRIIVDQAIKFAQESIFSQLPNKQ